MILFPFSFLQFALLVEDPQKENDGPYEIRKKKKRGLISDVIRKSRLEVGITSLLFCFPLQVYLSRLMSRFSRFQRNKLRMISIKKKKKPHVPNKKKKKNGPVTISTGFLHFNQTVLFGCFKCYSVATVSHCGNWFYHFDANDQLRRT